MIENNKNQIILAIDTYGADGGESVVIDGCDYIANQLNVFFIFVGNKSLITPLINKSENLKSYNIINTLDYIKANAKCSDALRSGKESSMRIAVDLVKDGKADAVISAGNTGALLAISYIVLRTIDGISRPAMTAYFPTMKGKTAMLDLGANIECDPKNLIDFALMGSAFSRIILKSSNPTVGLLNVGEESQKGNSIIQDAAALLNNLESKVNYYGFVEGNDIAEGNVDVIITDGFSGNIALKTAEGTANFITTELRQALNSSLLGKISTLLNIKNLKKFKKKLDPRLYNGAILLGIDKPVIKSHGSTDEIGFANSLKVCEKIIKGKLIDKIKKNII